MNQKDSQKKIDQRNHLLEEIIHLLKAQQLEEIPLSQNQQRPDLTYSILHKQQIQRLRNRLSRLHPADIADLLEALPQQQRQYVWEHIEADKAGEVLLELADAVRSSLLSTMAHHELISAAETLDSDEIADLAPDMPPKVVNRILTSLNPENRQQLEAVLSYEEGTVGALMDFNMITIREDITIKGILRYCRKLGDLPEKTNQMFVVDREKKLKGSLPLQKLVATPGNQLVASVMNRDIVSFTPDGDADKAAQAFDRYELITAPVVNQHNRLVGRLSVDNIIDYTREQAEDDMLNQAGLAEDEDMFSGVWKGVQNRWFWLAMNLATAFIATRVISIFEDTIVQLVALATLMPVVAAVGGNTGNQTSMLIIRSLALEQINAGNIRQLLFKEIAISVINGLLWGAVMAMFVYMVYQHFHLGLVMMGAIFLNLLLATLAGIAVPMIRHHFDLDPAMGTSVILTFIADSLGFFIFLGLAAVFL